MTASESRDPLGEAVRREAAGWFARLHGPHDESDMAKFDVWRAADPAHAIAYDRLTRTSERTAFIGNSQLGRSRQLRRAGFLARHPRTGYAAAASIAAVIVFGFSIGLRNTTSHVEPQIAASAPHFATRVGEVRTVVLPDGSRLTIDTASIVRTAFSPAQRQLWLDAGRARFEVAHDAHRPFIVHAGGGAVIAHGTIFDVSLTPVGVKVVLLRGAIEIQKVAAAGTPKASRYLEPGQQMTFDTGHPLAEPEPAKAADQLWASGMLSFDGMRLADAVAAISRYHSHKLSVASDAIGNLLVSGAFRANDAEGFAQAMAAAFDLAVIHRPDGTIVLAPPATTEKAPPK